MRTLLRRKAAAERASANADDSGVTRVETGEPRLKVCVLAACPFPANHGTPGSIRELVEATAERGHEVHVVTYHIGEPLPLRNVHVHRIADWTRERSVTVGPTRYRPLYDFQMIFKALKVMRRHRLDLMHAHGYEAALVAACCRPAVRVPVLYSAHNSMGDELASYDFFFSKRMANGLAWALDRTVPRIGDRCVPHSANLQQFLHDRGLSDRMEPVLNFGVDFDKLPTGDRRRLRSECNLTNEPIILYSGVIDQFQRLDLLLESMVHVLSRHPRAKLLLLTNVHNDKAEMALRDQARALGIEGSLVMMAPRSLDHGLKLISICDVAVVPRPKAPGFPIKLLNYMAARRPCVMYASSCSRLSHGEHVWLAADDTAESLGGAIVRVLKDETLRNRIAEGGHQFVRARHDRRMAAAQLCDSYLRLLRPTRRWKEIAARPAALPNELEKCIGSDSNREHSLESELNAYA
ncbi:MAG: glycosyltransferase family 4 protein [Planctomycetaceae bacterium]|nr:glycosyltransferase family 4 protein [Planctomycetaceae bacterium]